MRRHMGVVEVSVDAMPVICVILHSVEIRYRWRERKVVAIKRKQGDYIPCVKGVAKFSERVAFPRSPCA